MYDTYIANIVRSVPGYVGLSVWNPSVEGPITVLALDRNYNRDHGDLVPSDARVMDAMQFYLGGPGTEAMTGRVIDGSQRSEFFGRWPLLAPAAAALGITGAIAVPVPTVCNTAGSNAPADVGCVVNLYLGQPPASISAMVGLARFIGELALLPRGRRPDRVAAGSAPHR
jgi:hypothetical protein